MNDLIKGLIDAADKAIKEERYDDLIVSAQSTGVRKRHSEHFRCESYPSFQSVYLYGNN